MSELDLANITPTYYQIEIKDEPDDDNNFIKTEIITMDDNLTQFVIKTNSPLGNSHYDHIPSSSSDFSMLVEEVKQEPEEILQDLILPDVVEIDDDYNQPTQVIIGDQIVAYEIQRNQQGELECPVCRAIFKIGVNLERHIQIHDKKFVISIAKSTQKSALQKLPAILSYPCTYCSERFEFKKSLRKHVTDNHKNRRRIMKCKDCPYTTDTVTHFREHQWKHLKSAEKTNASSEMPSHLIKCPKCPTFLKNERNLRIHDKNVHSNVKVPCEICDKKFKTKSILNHHMRTIHA